MKISEAFGHILKQERTRATLTQEGLAERANLDVDAIGIYEQGKREPLVRSLIKITKGLNIGAGLFLKMIEEIL